MDIKALKAQGFSQRAVARLLGVHRDAVRRVWNEEVPRPYQRAPRPTKVDAHREHLEARLKAAPGLCATRLFREVRYRRGATRAATRRSSSCVGPGRRITEPGRPRCASRLVLGCKPRRTGARHGSCALPQGSA